MKIGIITMHNVPNYGSALQAYALQEKLSELGFDCEIIDYIFDENIKLPFTVTTCLNAVISATYNAIFGFPQKKKNFRFQKFYRDNFKLSKTKYNAKTILEHPPVYDIYMVGSDQVWNPRHVKDDLNFLLAFAPTGKPKYSYASSFATTVLPDEYKGLYSKMLNRFDSISVREQTGKKIVEELTGKNCQVSCDPTLLLDRNKWDAIACQSQINITGRYILVYELTYMFDPYPDVQKIYNHVQEMLGCQIIYLNGRKEYMFRSNSIVIRDAGPAEFLYLIRNAEVVITSSYHGTVFSLLYEKPILSIVINKDITDSRIPDLLKLAGLEDSIIVYNENFNMPAKWIESKKVNFKNLQSLISNSTNYLLNCLKKETR